mmetsp:Transcript_9689/g.10755  ORF Transcript_9689/g.10755 Transcript_9689/m.10755 type:complete len:435 (-) Transcript_9689:679-1983(-)
MVDPTEKEETTAIPAGGIPPTGDSAVVSPLKKKAVVKEKAVGCTLSQLVLMILLVLGQLVLGTYRLLPLISNYTATDVERTEINTLEFPPTTLISNTATDEAVVTVDYDFTVGICAIVKDADAYLDEWLDYHLVAMNIDNIYLYDHSKQKYLNKWYENTRNHPLYRRVHVTPWGHVEKKAQIKAYKDCILRFGKNTVLPKFFPKLSNMMNTTEMDYFALIDVDEFFMPRGNYTSVHGVVKDYLEPYGGALTVNWMFFGSANRTVYKPIPLLKRFQYRDKTAVGVIKTIVKASDFSRVRHNPHAVHVQPGKLVRTTRFKGAIQREQFQNVSKTGASSKDAAASPSSPLRLYHYRYLSGKEYDDKSCIRGEVTGRPKCNEETEKSYTLKELEEYGMPFHFAATPGTVFDDSAWKLLCDRVPKYRVFDDEISWGDYT